MAIAFTTASRQTAEGGIKILTHGRSGIGKTVLAATLPNPILISAESGLLSLRQENLERIYGKGNPDITYDMKVITVATVADFEAAYQWVIGPNGASFSSVAVDSLSEIAEKILKNEKGRTADGRMAYGKTADAIEEMVRKYRDMPGKNVYLSAKTEMVKDEHSGSMKFYPMMPGKKTGQSLDYFFDQVFYFDTITDNEDKTQRVLHTQINQQFAAKDRSGALAVYEAPNLSAIIRKIKGVSPQ